MENASKALILAAGVLIGILILSLAVFLFMDFGATSKGIYAQVEQRQLAQYNAQYTIYEGRKDITIYEIITLLNLAEENNNYYKDYTEYINHTDYEVNIILPSEMRGKDNQALIKNYSTINSVGELNQKFECTSITYHDSGRVKTVNIKK